MSTPEIALSEESQNILRPITESETADWSKVSLRMRWFAKSAHGEGVFFENKPELFTDYQGNKFWYSAGNRFVVNALSADNWENSLEQRPYTNTSKKPKKEPSEPQFLIIKDGLYYRQNFSGYTHNKAEAGRYSKDAAENHLSSLDCNNAVQMVEDISTQAEKENMAVDAISLKMKDKLALQRSRGWHGWETCGNSLLSELLVQSIHKGDPVDVANFATFIFARGEMIFDATANSNEVR